MDNVAMIFIKVECNLCGARMPENRSAEHHASMHPTIGFDEQHYDLQPAAIGKRSDIIYDKLTKLTKIGPTPVPPPLQNIDLKFVDCSICLNRFPASALRKHLERVHWNVATIQMIDDQPMVIDEANVALRVRCPHCGDKALWNEIELDTHIKAKHSEQYVQIHDASPAMVDTNEMVNNEETRCEFCSHTMVKSAMDRHVKRKHSNVGRNEGQTNTDSRSEVGALDKIDSMAPNSDQMDDKMVIRCVYCQNFMPNSAMSRHIKRKHLGAGGSQPTDDKSDESQINNPGAIASKTPKPVEEIGPLKKSLAEPTMLKPAKPNHSTLAKPTKPPLAEPTKLTPVEPHERMPAEPIKSMSAGPLKKSSAEPTMLKPARPNHPKPTKPTMLTLVEPHYLAPAEPSKLTPAEPTKPKPAKPNYPTMPTTANPTKPTLVEPHHLALAEPNKSTPAKPTKPTPARPQQRMPAEPNKQSPTGPTKPMPTELKPTTLLSHLRSEIIRNSSVNSGGSRSNKEIRLG